MDAKATGENYQGTGNSVFMYNPTEYRNLYSEEIWETPL